MMAIAYKRVPLADTFDSAVKITGKTVELDGVVRTVLDGPQIPGRGSLIDMGVDLAIVKKEPVIVDSLLEVAKDFETNKIILNFIKMGDINFDNPYTSILDLIFRYTKEEIKKELKNYTLI